jgi:hypothetical protein
MNFILCRECAKKVAAGLLVAAFCNHVDGPHPPESEVSDAIRAPVVTQVTTNSQPSMNRYGVWISDRTFLLKS